MRSPAAEFFMARAIELGRSGAAAGDGGPFGAVIVRDGAIVGEGWNRVVATKDPTAHGEIVAIRNACRAQDDFSLRGAEIYTSGEPCPMCLGAIHWAGLARVYYGFSIEDAASAGFDDCYIWDQFQLSSVQRAIPHRQLLANEALALLEEYIAMPQRVPY